MKTILSTFALLLALSFHAFAQSTSDQTAIFQEGEISKEVLSALMITCYVCHNPRIKAEADIIAPPLAAVKYMYKNKFPDKKQFVEKITDFVMNPNNQKALLQGPIMRFGVMPDMPLNEEQVKNIAAYIFDNEIEEPVWFPEHFENTHGVKWEGQ
ncbi:MAG: cytochrome c553 [Cyclobacteriaceae bacterium]|jgi:cytochrome c553